MSTRRGFIAALVGLVSAPFSRLSRPGSRNTLITPEWISREARAHLNKPLMFHKDAFSMVFPSEPRVGDTIHVRIPERFKNG